MIALDCDDRFETWREQARTLLGHGIDPAEVTWSQGPIHDLLATPEGLPEGPGPFKARVPAELLAQLQLAGRYRGEQRWSLLYEVLWRVAHGDRTAMLAGDRLGSELQRRIKQVTREAHHLHAFVRFVPLPPALAERLQLDLVAWHEPAHDILDSASGHFAEGCELPGATKPTVCFIELGLQGRDLIPEGRMGRFQSRRHVVEGSYELRKIVRVDRRRLADRLKGIRHGLDDAHPARPVKSRPEGEPVVPTA